MVPSRLLRNEDYKRVKICRTCADSMITIIGLSKNCEGDEYIGHIIEANNMLYEAVIGIGNT